MSTPNEARFEEWIQQSIGKQGYQHLFTHSNEFASDYDKVSCLLPNVLIDFIKSTQEKTYQKLYAQFDETTNEHLIKTFAKTIKDRGIVHTLRHGIETRGCSFSLIYFKPKSGNNADHFNLYNSNVFSAVRQLHYSNQNNNSIDLVLFINGIPVVTIEIKNQLTGQNVFNAINQYKTDRSPKEPLLAFKRCLVHFAVDNDQAFMTTRLNNGETRFFPYNKDIQNPIVEGDYSSEYLWNEVLAPDSLLDIIENYAVVAQDSSKEWNSKTKKVITKKYDVLYFPRYHQLDVTRKIQAALKTEGTGKNYLIQHTTGAGKSMEIGWLAHSLTSLYQKPTDTKRMFDTVIVVTDRKVLDTQLQRTLLSLEQTSGVVNPVDINSQQLKEFLEKGKDIIVTTVQKFGVISKVISATKSKTFAVIIDEVHSSQSGETSKHLKKSLTAGQDSDHDQDGDYDLEDYIRHEIESRGVQNHISFFGFTGTPKNKTLELFGRKNSDGQFVPFHSYSMKQSIAEGYTLDVLANYTTFKRFFKVKQKLNEDIEVPSGEAKKVLMQFVDSHPEVIKNKVRVIIDQFVNYTSKEINGTARAMVVVRSRLHCVLYQQEMKKQMREKHLPYTCLVAFSGTVKHDGEEFTETSINKENGMTGSNIPDSLKDPSFRILIVSNKFQTGFDEPMVHTMFVDKKLNGVQCVQTLSRLNRTKTNKQNPVVIDFVNETEDIQNAFQPYFTSTVLSNETDPDQLYSLVYEIEQFHLFTQQQIDDFASLFYVPSNSDQALQPLLNECINNYIRLDEEAQAAFKSKIQSFIRLYAYIIQISGFGEVKWEKLYIFLKYLNKKLPRDPKERKIAVDDAVELESLRIQFKGRYKIGLEDEQGTVEPIGVSDGGGKDEDPIESLSEIINKINERNQTDFTEDDVLSLGELENRLVNNDEMTKVKNGNNTKDTVKDYYRKLLQDELVDFAADKMGFYKRMQRPENFMLAFEMMFDRYLNSK